MTPKEKAKELIESFAETIEPITIGVLVERNWNSAKHCALIAVDEVIELIKSDTSAIIVELQYWQEVRQEIEKL